MRAHELFERLLIAAGALCLIGGIFLALHFAISGALPKWSIFQWLGAAILAGVGALVAEALFWPIQRTVIDPDKVTDPLWKRSIRFLVILAIGAAIVFVPIIWQLK